jgi:hypothetical protein
VVKRKRWPKVLNDMDFLPDGRVVARVPAGVKWKGLAGRGANGRARGRMDQANGSSKSSSGKGASKSSAM